MKILAQAIREYAQALRGDWGSIDGRSERVTLDQFATAAETQDDTLTIEEWRALANLCPHGNGNWELHCDHLCDEAGQ